MLRRLCEALGHFYLNVCFQEETADSYVVERKQEIERSSVCVLLLKSTVSRCTEPRVYPRGSSLPQ